MLQTSTRKNVAEKTLKKTQPKKHDSPPPYSKTSRVVPGGEKLFKFFQVFSSFFKFFQVFSSFFKFFQVFPSFLKFSVIGFAILAHRADVPTGKMLETHVAKKYLRTNPPKT